MAFSTREDAAKWLSDRVQHVFKMAGLIVVLAPVASALVLVVRHAIRAKELPTMAALLPATLMWSVVVIALGGLSAALIGKRRFAAKARMAPIVSQGTETRGTVESVVRSESQAAGVTMTRLTLTLAFEDGTRREASIEESAGTELPKVDVGMPALVWMLDGKLVAAVGDGLFESHLPVR